MIITAIFCVVAFFFSMFGLTIPPKYPIEVARVRTRLATLENELAIIRPFLDQVLSSNSSFLRIGKQRDIYSYLMVWRPIRVHIYVCMYVCVHVKSGFISG